MNSPAPTKTLTLLLAAAFLLPGVCVLHGQTGRSHQGYLTLSVHSGSGDGSCYSKGQRVRIGAETPSGFEFVKWFKVKGDGELTSPLEPSGDFTMGSGDSEIAATFAKLETWFPPGPEGTTKGLLLPKPASGQATRLEHRLRVTLNRGPSPGPPYSEIWSALSVKMKWEAATHVRFFTSQSGGQEVKSNTIVPSSSFKPKGEGIYEASLWYQGNLTQKQIAQMSQSGQKPEVKIQLNIAVEGKDKPTSATASLLPVEIEFMNQGMTGWKIVRPTSLPNTRIGVMKGDAVDFKIKLPSGVDTSLFQWSGEKTGAGETITVSFKTLGNRTLTAFYSGSRVFDIAITVVEITGVGEVTWLLMHPHRVNSAFALKSEADYISGWNDQGDARRHAYLSGIFTIEWGATDAEGLTTAHEVSGLSNGNPHNEIVMDLENNSRGRSLVASSEMTRAQLNTAIQNALNSGILTILDETGQNGSWRGLLKPSNK